MRKARKPLTVLDKSKVVRENKLKPKEKYSVLEKGLPRHEIQISGENVNKMANLFINGIGLQASALLPKEKVLYLGMCSSVSQANTHIVVYGNVSMGKTSIFSRVFPEMANILSGNVTTPQLLGSLTNGNKKGALATAEVVVMDDFHRFETKEDVLGKLLNYMATGNISRDENNEKSNASLVFMANFKKEHQEALNTTPYANTKKTLLEALGESFAPEDFRSRVTIIPIWICRDTLPILAEVEGTYGYPVEYMVEYFKEHRDEVLDPANFNKVTPARLNDNAQNIYNGIIKLLQLPFLDDKDFRISSIDREGIRFLAEKFSRISFDNKDLKLTGPEAINQLWVKLSEDFMPYPVTGIVEAYVDEHRATVRFKDEKDCYYKIALDKIGIQQNQAEVEYYKNANVLQELLVKTASCDKDFIRIKAETPYSPESNYHRINNCVDIFQHKEINEEDIPNEIKEYIRLSQEKRDQEIISLKKEYKEIRKAFDELVTEVISNKGYRKSLNFYRSSHEEIVEDIEEKIEGMAKLTNTPKENFKTYHFVWDTDKKTPLLLHYSHLKSDNMQEIVSKMMSEEF